MMVIRRVENILDSICVIPSSIKKTILKVLVKVEFNNVHGWEVHEPKAEACHEPNGDIEDGKGWSVKIFDGESSHQQTKGR